MKRLEDCPIGVKNSAEIEAMKSYNDMKFVEIDGKISALFEKVDNILLEIYQLRDKYSERLPVWANVVFGVLMTLIGVLGTLVAETMRMKGGL